MSAARPGSSVAERNLGKIEVEGSIPSLGSHSHSFSVNKITISIMIWKFHKIEVIMVYPEEG